MRYDTINSQLFIDNRKKLVKYLKPNSLAIFNSNDEMPRSSDMTFTFRQNSDLLWLSGIDQEESILLLYPDCPKEEYREALFLKKTNEHIAVWEGHKYTKEEAEQTSGIKNIYWIEEFDKIFLVLMNWVENCYLNLNEHDRYVHHVPYRDLRFAYEVKNRFPLHKYERTAPTLHHLRSIKSSFEVELISKAIEITGKAFHRTLKFVKPGVMEYEIEAEITHEFIWNRATGHAYNPIIATGKNACVLHYNSNAKACKKGELVLMDFGAEYANYAADLTRTIPVSGTFSKRQRQVYNSVLKVMRGATAMLVAGNKIEDYHKEVGKLMEEELIKLKLLNRSDVKKQDEKNPLYKKYFMHGTSHHLGLDVHDFGTRPFEEIKAGMVFTCEPGIYIPKEKIGIRLENDILVTKNQPMDLMAAIPVEADEIEDLMKERIKN